MSIRVEGIGDGLSEEQRNALVIIGLWTKSRLKRDEPYGKGDNDDFNNKTRHHPKIHYAYSSH
jgi:hypothetical protein